MRAGVLVAPIAALWISGSLATAQEQVEVERGEYLARRVAMCGQCHTPRDESGRPIESRLFQGSPVPVGPPPYPGWEWASRAPRIAGLPGYTEDEAVRLLTEGFDRHGKRPRPPMPPFRFSEADARAIAAYLRSLP